MRARVTLTTDFGLRDGYVGAMKGAILRRAPDVELVDITHGVPPGDVESAAYVVAQATGEFPDETVHLVVVDPGVGTARRALAARIGPQTYVAPDNGVLSLVLPREASGAPWHAAEIAAPRFVPEDASPVFHGRDIFGPVAAFLARGGALDAVGPALERRELVVLDLEHRAEPGRAATGRVVYVDHFGNLVTNLRLPDLRLSDAGPAGAGPAGARVRVAGREVALRRTYGDVGPGEPVALRGSTGRLEVACNGASAAGVLGVGIGAVVEFLPT